MGGFGDNRKRFAKASLKVHGVLLQRPPKINRELLKTEIPVALTSSCHRIPRLFPDKNKISLTTHKYKM